MDPWEVDRLGESGVDVGERVDLWKTKRSNIGRSTLNYISTCWLASALSAAAQATFTVRRFSNTQSSRQAHTVLFLSLWKNNRQFVNAFRIPSLLHVPIYKKKKRN